MTPEQQKKVPVTQTWDEKHAVNGNLIIVCDFVKQRLEGKYWPKTICFQRTPL